MAVTPNSRTFPLTPQRIALELNVGPGWIDATDDVRWAEGCAITRGRLNETAQTTPQNCAFVLKNSTGNYSPRNPLGAYFGTLTRNTPMRLSLIMAADSFTRTVSNGWGSTNEGWAWTTSGGSASDYAVNGSAGTMTHSNRTTPHFASLQALSTSDVDVSFSVAASTVAPITGGSLFAGVRVKSDGTHYYQLSLTMSATTPLLSIGQADGTAIGPTVSISRCTYAANTPIMVRLQVEGQIFRAKAWMFGTQPEPVGWDIVWSEGDSAELNDLQSGWVTLYTAMDSANSNTLPITFTIDNVQVRSPRFAGEVAEWPQSWDTTMSYGTVSVTAAGPLRRLLAGRGPSDSSLRRHITRQSPYAYWPLEDGAASPSGINLGPSTSPIQAIQAGTASGSGAVKWAQDNTILGGGPAPALNQGAQLYGWIDPNPIQGAGAWTVCFAARITRTAGTTVILSSNGPFAVSVNLLTDGSATVYLTQIGGSTLMASFAALGADAIDGVWHMYSVTAAQSGGNVVVTMNRDGAENSGTTALGVQGFQAVAQCVFPTPLGVEDQLYFGHVGVWGSDLGLSARTAIYSAFTGHKTEVVLDRLKRLCSEEGIEFGYNDSTDFVFTPQMGPQRAQPVGQLIQECVNTDVGELVESRGSSGLHYFTQAWLNNRPTRLTLSLSGQQLAPPFLPIDDDQNTRNSVTATAPDGSAYRYQKTSGALSTATPPNGAGLYDSSWSANAFVYYVLSNIAAWLVGLGTVDKPRYSALRVNRATGAVVASGWSGAFATLLMVDIRDKITVTGMSPSGLYDDAELTVIGMKELLHTQKHEFVFTTQPEEPQHVGIVAGTTPAATDSRLDTDGAFLTAAITSSATSFQVTTFTGNQPWTTAAGDFPFDIMCDGERMTVTNITGATSPQTFTVTRSVNGVVKAHVLGSDVRLFHPFYVGL